MLSPEEDQPATTPRSFPEDQEWQAYVTREEVLDATKYLDKRHGEKQDVRLCCVGKGLWFILVGPKPYGGICGFTARVHAYRALTGHATPDPVHPRRRAYEGLEGKVNGDHA